ncbi:MAG: hypothetical protein ACRBK7_08855 [Acidimicrobiales bacterium]
MTRNRERMERVAKVAGETEAQARAMWVEADRQVLLLDQRRQDTLAKAELLGGDDVPLGLRGHLVGLGARHLLALAGEKKTLASEAELRRSEFEEAAVKVRSLDRLVERLDKSVKERRIRVEQADLQDAMTIRAAREAS